MLPTTTAQLDTLGEMVREARGPVRPLVVTVGAQWAQFAGWLHLSADQPDRAATMLGRALEWAIEVGDREMIATVLSFKGHAARLAGSAARGGWWGGCTSRSFLCAASRSPRVCSGGRLPKWGRPTAWMASRAAR